MTFHKYRNIGLLAQISCQLLVCSGKSQLHNYAIVLFKNIDIDLAYIMSRLLYVMT